MPPSHVAAASSKSGLQVFFSRDPTTLPLFCILPSGCRRELSCTPPCCPGSPVGPLPPGAGGGVSEESRRSKSLFVFSNSTRTSWPHRVSVTCVTCPENSTSFWIGTCCPGGRCAHGRGLCASPVVSIGCLGFCEEPRGVCAHRCFQTGHHWQLWVSQVDRAFGGSGVWA